jgi:hypothetical protein
LASKQARMIKQALTESELSPTKGADELDKIRQTEPLSPVSKALLEMQSIELRRKGGKQE